MSETPRPIFPPEQAFVVQFIGGDAAGADTCRGRVEHVVSGRSSRFDSTTELFDFIANVRHDVESLAAKSPGEPSRRPVAEADCGQPRRQARTTPTG